MCVILLYCVNRVKNIRKKENREKKIIRILFTYFMPYDSYLTTVYFCFPSKFKALQAYRYWQSTFLFTQKNWNLNRYLNEQCLTRHYFQHFVCLFPFIYLRFRGKRTKRLYFYWLYCRAIFLYKRKIVNCFFHCSPFWPNLSTNFNESTSLMNWIKE